MVVGLEAPARLHSVASVFSPALFLDDGSSIHTHVFRMAARYSALLKNKEVQK